jgi:hypothetical protein
MKRQPPYDEIVDALRGMVACVEGYTDADLSAQGLKRTSRCMVDARAILERVWAYERLRHSANHRGSIDCAECRP